MARRFRLRRPEESGEFIWLMSLSDLMILLFLFFVMLFSFTYKKIDNSEFQTIVAALKNTTREPTILEKMGGHLSKWVEEQKLSDQINVQEKAGTLVMEMKDKLFFESGAYEPSVSGLKVLRSVKGFLEQVPSNCRIGIEGHTDDVPIHNKEVSDNWDLSSRRALSVFYALNLPPTLQERTVVMAYGDKKPVAPNRDDKGNALVENQSKNRRVTLRLYTE